MMLACWEIDPEDRPDFKSLASDLAESLACIADYLTLEQDVEISVIADGNAHGSSRYVRYPALKIGECLDSGFIENGSIDDGFLNTGFVDNGFIDLQHLDNNVVVMDTSRPASYVDPNSMPCSDNEMEDGFVTPEPTQRGMIAQRQGERGGVVVIADLEGERMDPGPN